MKKYNPLGRYHKHQTRDASYRSGLGLARRPGDPPREKLIIESWEYDLVLETCLTCPEEYTKIEEMGFPNHYLCHTLQRSGNSIGSMIRKLAIRQPDVYVPGPIRTDRSKARWNWMDRKLIEYTYKKAVVEGWCVVAWVSPLLMRPPHDVSRWIHDHVGELQKMVERERSKLRRERE